MEKYYDQKYDGSGHKYLEAYNEIEKVQALKHLTIRQLRNIKSFNFDKFNLYAAYKTFVAKTIDKRVQVQILSMYLLYSVKLSDELPERYQFDGWQKCKLDDNAIEELKSYYIQCYPFECYIIRQKKLPSQHWIDKNTDYYINPLTSQFICQNFSIEQIEKLRKMMNADSFEYFIFGVCLQKCNDKYKNVITKYIDIAKKFVVDFFYVNNFILDVFKQGDWQKRTAQQSDKQIRNKTIFQYLLEKYCNTAYENRNIIYKLQDYLYEGCLQQRFYYQEFMLTPAQLYLYKFDTIAPDFLLYPGWEKEKFINRTNGKLSFRQFWVTQKKTPIPQQLLQYYNDEDIKTIYQKLIGESMDDDDFNEYEPPESSGSSSDYVVLDDSQVVIDIVGDSKDAYTYWHEHEKLQQKFYEKYKIINDTTIQYNKCLVCKKKCKELYNFCDNDHDGKGICMNCFMHMKKSYCPVCGEDIIIYDSSIALCRVINNF